MEKLADSHYCSSCAYFDELDAPCHVCSYSEDKGFSEWRSVKIMNDVVNKPKHYILMDGLEVRDVLAALVAKIRREAKEDDYPQAYSTSVLFESDYVQMMQYLMRFMDKNGKQDLEKAQWYLNKLILAYD